MNKKREDILETSLGLGMLLILGACMLTPCFLGVVALIIFGD
jgi:hypothetical protein